MPGLGSSSSKLNLAELRETSFKGVVKGNDTISHVQNTGCFRRPLAFVISLGFIAILLNQAPQPATVAAG